jgi:hypothetical protein
MLIEVYIYCHHVGYSIKGILASMITNTRPSRKERISFRDKPVQLSGGWGSGKKKVKTSA